MCGSFRSRHCWQRTSAGADVFHCARRERVLLRDVLRFGTATVSLLLGRDRWFVDGKARPATRPTAGRFSRAGDRDRRRAASRSPGTVPGSPRCTPAGAAAPAPARPATTGSRSSRCPQAEVLVLVVGALTLHVGVDEQLLDVGGDLPFDRLEAAHAFAGVVPAHRPGDQHAFQHRLEAQVQIEVGALASRTIATPRPAGGGTVTDARRIAPGRRLNSEVSRTSGARGSSRAFCYVRAWLTSSRYAGEGRRSGYPTRPCRPKRACPEMATK